MEKGEEKSLFIHNIENLCSGKLYLKVKGRTRSHISSAWFETDEAPLRKIKLGIVITHYNRQDYVIPSVKRICRELEREGLINRCIDVVVVDNSQNLNDAEIGQAVVIKNENTGGSGGFTRGLLYLKDNNFTHCLFSDDDGSYEVESVLRVFHLYEHEINNNPKLAFSGILLRFHSPNIVIEKGSVFDGEGFFFKQNKGFARISTMQDVNYLDNGLDNINYGAWCFFAFQISGVQFWPFPVFIRGDDVLFSIRNNFEIKTVCGIACYVDEFEPKESPLTKYFGYRGFVINQVNLGKLKLGVWVKSFLVWYLSSLFSYQYASASAIEKAHLDMLDGGKVFIEDKFSKNIRTEIKQINFEIPKMIDLSKIKNIKYPENRKQSCLSRLFRAINLNGVLLPGVLLNDSIVLQKMAWRAIFSQIYLHKYVLFYDENKCKGYTTKLNRKLILRRLIVIPYLIILTVFKYSSCVKKLKSLLDETSTEEFWRRYLGLVK